jgi:hypothetical protein
MSTLIDRIACHSWNREVADEPWLHNMLSMLGLNERRMLHWLAREFDLTDGEAIVDLGSFLGGSSISLATGLAANTGISNKDYRIHSYDIFIAPTDESYLEYLGPDTRPGMSTMPFLLRTLGQHARSVFVHAGDFLQAAPPFQPIGILFVDIAKSWELNDVVLSRFFSRLIPGRSLLIQQDYNDHSCPWINLTMVHLAEYFQILCDDHGSRVYLYTRQIPSDVLTAPLRGQIPPAEMLAGMDRAWQAEHSLHSRFFTYVTMSWLVFEFEGIQKATEHLGQCHDRIGYPWPEAGEYLDTLTAIMVRTAETVSQPHYGLDFA